MGWFYEPVARSAQDRQGIPQPSIHPSRPRRPTISAALGPGRHEALLRRCREDNQATQAKEVCCAVCLVNYNLRDKEGFIFGYKDMDETMHQFANDCPVAIQNLLTPTDSENALTVRLGTPFVDLHDLHLSEAQ